MKFTMAVVALAIVLWPTASTEDDVFLFKPLLRAPMVQFHTLSGDLVALDSFKGKVVFLNYWATWCAACREEMPQLEKLRAQYAPHLEIVAISMDDQDMPAKKLQDVIQGLHVSFPVTRVSEGFAPAPSVPYTVVIDQAGNIRQRHPGLVPLRMHESEVKALLGMVPGTRIVLVDASNDFEKAPYAPGLREEFSRLDPANTERAWKKLNDEKCPCGCGRSLAACRFEDPACTASLGRAREVILELQK